MQHVLIGPHPIADCIVKPLTWRLTSLIVNRFWYVDGGLVIYVSGMDKWEHLQMSKCDVVDFHKSD